MVSALRSSRSNSRPRRRGVNEEDARTLRDLWSVGPAIERDLTSLGVRSVAQLARRSPERLYRQLERTRGKKPDPCVLDTFRAAVAQALDPALPREQCVWWYYSALRGEDQPRNRRRLRSSARRAGHSEGRGDRS
jgi:hypothetical protein